MTRRLEDRLLVAIATIAMLGLALAMFVASAHAEEASTPASTVRKAPTKKAATPAAAAVAIEAQQKIDELSRQVAEMRRMMESAQKEIKSLNEKVAATQAATTVVGAEAALAGAEAGAAGAVAGGTAAQTASIGQTVGMLGKDLGQMREDIAKNLGIQVHGLVDANYEYNVNQPSQKSNLGATNQFRAFDTDANSFELEQFNLRIQRRVEGGVGFLVDLNFGKTAEVLRTFTRYTSNPAGVGIGEVDPTQAYITYTVPIGNGLDVMAGKFVTLLGAEVIKTYDALNYNESGSYIFTLGIPFTHTGLRAKYVFNEMLAVTGGFN
ncbi:MAG: outer membrane beta-barrel protein, partial [Candidatus Binataceae bacterium]